MWKAMITNKHQVENVDWCLRRTREGDECAVKHHCLAARALFDVGVIVRSKPHEFVLVMRKKCVGEGYWSSIDCGLSRATLFSVNCRYFKVREEI